MSLCAPCTKLKTLNFCGPTVDPDEDDLNVIIIGHSLTHESGQCNLTGPLFAYFKSLATGAVYSIPIIKESLENNYCGFSIEYNGNFPLATGTDYEFWIGEAGSAIEDGIDIVIDDNIALSGTGCITASCFIINAERIYDLENEVYIQATIQTLKCFT